MRITVVGVEKQPGQYGAAITTREFQLRVTRCYKAEGDCGEIITFKQDSNFFSSQVWLDPGNTALVFLGRSGEFFTPVADWAVLRIEWLKPLASGNTAALGENVLEQDLAIG